jgi:PAS domain S-box-containing protein
VKFTAGSAVPKIRRGKCARQGPWNYRQKSALICWHAGYFGVTGIPHVEWAATSVQADTCVRLPESRARTTHSIDSGLPARARAVFLARHRIANHAMTANEEKAERVEELLATPDLAEALDNEHFRRFLDQIPIAIILSELKSRERIIYANPEFEKLSGQTAAEVEGKPWDALHGQDDSAGSDGGKLAAAITAASDCVGTFRIERGPREPAIVDAYSNIIEDDDGKPAFRLVALVDVSAHEQGQREQLENRIREKDMLLREIQHRVKNNLQMITTLIRLEARRSSGGAAAAPFDRLAGRIEALALLYQSLSDVGDNSEIDLGVYLSQIASAVMRSHAIEGIRLDLKVDAYPVSVNVAMPTGLVVNELLTNALKHAFQGREGGTITLHSLVDGNGCRVIIADDGVGLPAGVEWPKRGRLGALIVQTLRENAKAGLEVESKPNQGTRVTIRFTRTAAAPEGKS